MEKHWRSYGKNQRLYLVAFEYHAFFFTSVFSKLASNCLNRDGIRSLWLYIFLFLSFLNCFVYALAWQKVIKKFELNVAYANRSIYLIWSQVWAVAIFHENFNCEEYRRLTDRFCGRYNCQYADRREGRGRRPYECLHAIDVWNDVFDRNLPSAVEKSANQTYKSWIYEYLNWRVIVAYGIFFRSAAGEYLRLYAGGYEIWRCD
mgnify:CR=1 FL=1